MIKTTKALIAFVILNSIIIACSTVPLTNRTQLNMIPDSELQAMSYQQYGEFLKENKLSKNQSQTQMVKRAGKNIQSAVTQYLADNNYAQLLEGYAWEFNLVESYQVNA